MPFVVFGANDQRLSGHDDVYEAVAALPTNGILRLCWDGPRVVPPVVLPPWPVSVRRMTGFQPLWVATHASGPALLATAPLLLAGPEFEYRTPAAATGPGVGTTKGSPGPEFPGDSIPDDLAIVQVTGASLRVSGCAFRADFGQAAGPFGFACVALDNCPAGEIETSVFDSPRTIGIRWRLTSRAGPGGRAPSTLRIGKTAILAGDAVWFSAADDRTARLDIEEASFDGRTFLFLEPETRRAASLIVDIRSGVFRSDWILIDRRRDDTASLPDWIAWSWKPTICRPVHGFTPARTPGSGPLVRTREEWDSLWAKPTPSAAPEKPHLEP